MATLGTTALAETQNVFLRLIRMGILANTQIDANQSPQILSRRLIKQGTLPNCQRAACRVLKPVVAAVVRDRKGILTTADRESTARDQKIFES